MPSLSLAHSSAILRTLKFCCLKYFICSAPNLLYVMHCTFAVPSRMWKGSHLIIPAVTAEKALLTFILQELTRKQRLLPIFLWLVWMKWTICAWFRITDFFGSPLEWSSYCKSCNPGHDKIPDVTYFRAKGLSVFPAAFWYWQWHMVMLHGVDAAVEDSNVKMDRGLTFC